MAELWELFNAEAAVREVLADDLRVKRAANEFVAERQQLQDDRV